MISPVCDVDPALGLSAALATSPELCDAGAFYAVVHRIKCPRFFKAGPFASIVCNEGEVCYNLRCAISIAPS
eukprot:6180928-Pleurochrysis_carterae.AAC.3